MMTSFSPSQSTSSPLHVVVPFYKNETLVDTIVIALQGIAAELAEANATVYFYNDSPDYLPLAARLSEHAGRQQTFPLHVIRNPENLGFVGTCNKAFDAAIADGADVLLLNSDTFIFPGTLREILKVAHSDPMIGFVCPRSNNATIATLPHRAGGQELTPEQGHESFLGLSKHLPDFTFVPTAVGFCLWIRGTLLAEFGGFDPVYGKGYNEENDLIMRANRCGYRAALANHAFTWHESGRSFSLGEVPRNELDRINAQTLQARYPEYVPWVQAYFNSPEYRAESLLEQLSPPPGQKLRLAFDLSSFTASHNGTFEAGIKLLRAAAKTWPSHYQICVYVDEAVWDFHRLGDIPNVQRLGPHDPDAKAAAVIRMGQPYNVSDLQRVINRTPIAGIYMMDAISYDCGYLALDFDAELWRFVFLEFDLAFTISDYSRDRLDKRFAIDSGLDMVVSRLSLVPDEYIAKPKTANISEHVFVIGNHYAHKFVKSTVDAMARKFPDTKIITTGYGNELPPANVHAYHSGKISDDEFEKFYANASVIVFPSHYEGFGFPLLHALAWRKPVFVRDTELNRELCQHIPAAQGNVHLYATTRELTEKLAQGFPTWRATEEEAATTDDGWERSAQEVLVAVEKQINHFQYARLLRRLRAFSNFTRHSAPAAQAPIYTPGQRLGLKMARPIDFSLRNSFINYCARLSARVYRKIRYQTG